METQFTCTVNSVMPRCISAKSVYTGASEVAAVSLPLTNHVEDVNPVPTFCVDNKDKISVGHAIFGKETLPTQNCEADTAKPAIGSSLLKTKPSDELLNPVSMNEQAEGDVSETERGHDSAHPGHAPFTKKASVKTVTASGALLTI